ncbi:hypothetical protein ACFX10_017580 [Malus domestica]
MPASIKICTRRSFRNRRGVCFLKSWVAQRPRGPISEIEEVFAFSKAGCSKTTKVDLKNRRGACFLKSWPAQRPRGPISEIEEAPAFSTLSASVTCTQLCRNYGHSAEDFW